MGRSATRDARFKRGEQTHQSHVTARRKKRERTTERWAKDEDFQSRQKERATIIEAKKLGQKIRLEKNSIRKELANAT